MRTLDVNVISVAEPLSIAAHGRKRQRDGEEEVASNGLVTPCAACQHTVAAEKTTADMTLAQGKPQRRPMFFCFDQQIETIMGNGLLLDEKLARDRLLLSAECAHDLLRRDAQFALDMLRRDAEHAHDRFRRDQQGAVDQLRRNERCARDELLRAAQHAEVLRRLDRLVRGQENMEVRRLNSFIRGPGDALRSVSDANGAHPPNFPRTYGELHSLPDAQLHILAQFYGVPLPPGRFTNGQRNRALQYIKNHLGVRL